MMSWKNLVKERRFLTEMIISIMILVIILLSLSRFLLFVEQRPGVIINDPLLALFHPLNLTWLIFGLIYFSLLAGIIVFIKDPQRLLFAFQFYSLLVLVRILMMYLVPLEAPPTMIPLQDPFVELFGSGGKLLTRDLFFSGHTSTLFMLFLIADKGILKNSFFVFTILVGISVIVQHVHYTIDVVAAPFFTYSVYRALLFSRKKLLQKKNY
jgi:hypothetical protein